VNEHDAIARIKRLSHSINCADEIAEVIERLIKGQEQVWLEIIENKNKRIKELEGLIDSAMEADYNNEYFRTHHK
jgi:chorismate mutase